jgi:predicted AlkP superfamily pyrophosphatase or phosphodiesterase
MLPAARLPAGRAHRFRLADVLPGCLDALGGRSTALGLAPVDHALVVLVDGLGLAALTARRGHARTLASRLERDAPISSGFPTTTASALATLATGTDSGRHGLVGYTAPAPDGRVVNHLTGWDDGALPSGWQRMPTCFERAAASGIRAVAIGPERYRGSGFTAAVLRGAEYLAGRSIAERFARARELLDGPPALGYLYIPELDTAAHARGWESDTWVAALEEVDAALAAFLPGAGPRDGVLVTADHGVVDVPHERQIIVDGHELEGVAAVAGEPRCLQLHLAPGVDADAVAARWREREGRRAWVAMRGEAIDAGWFGEVDPEVAPRIGDVLIAARERVAYYTDPEDRGRRMIGQHGSLSADELTIPLLRFARWSQQPA